MPSTESPSTKPVKSEKAAKPPKASKSAPAATPAEKPATAPLRKAKGGDPLYLAQRNIVLQRLATEAVDARYARNPDALAEALETEGYAFFRLRNPSIPLLELLSRLNDPVPSADGETIVNRNSNAATKADYALSMREARWDANGQPLKLSVNPTNGWAIPPATWDAKRECGAYNAPIGPFDPFDYVQHGYYAASLPDDAPASDYVLYKDGYGRAVTGTDLRHRVNALLSIVKRAEKGKFAGHVPPIDKADEGDSDADKANRQAERDAFADAYAKGHSSYKDRSGQRQAVDILFEIYLSNLPHRKLGRNQDTGRARSVADAVLLSEQPKPVVAWVAGLWNGGKSPDPMNDDNFRKAEGVDAPLKRLTPETVAKLLGDATRAASGLIGTTPVPSPSGKFRVDRIEAFGARQNEEGYTFAEALRDTLEETRVTYFLHRADDTFARAFVANEDKRTFNRNWKSRFGEGGDGLIVTDKAFCLALFALMSWKYETGAKMRDFVGGLVDGSLAGKVSVSNILSELAEWPGKPAGAESKTFLAFVLSRAWLAFTEGRAGKAYVPPHLTRAQFETEKDEAEGTVDDSETEDDEAPANDAEAQAAADAAGDEGDE